MWGVTKSVNGSDMLSHIVGAQTTLVSVSTPLPHSSLFWVRLLGCVCA